jgi:hypothetical protein
MSKNTGKVTANIKKIIDIYHDSVKKAPNYNENDSETEWR